jgi:hypothetical protein
MISMPALLRSFAGKAPRRIACQRRSRFCAAAALGSAILCAPALRAAPLPLESEADVASFAERLRAYAGASRVRWVIAARTRADAQAKIAEVEARLTPTDRYLGLRLSGQTLAETTSADESESAARAWISPQIGSTTSGPACSWQVWVTDPAFPSPDAEALTVPLAPNDHLPVGPSATFRVGHSGLLQSRLYAFDETRPGAIRDLAAAPDVNVPVATEATGETIFLATARQTAPFLERLKTALADSEGQRRDLGPQYALRTKLLGEGRGIGANIQVVPPNMIGSKTEAVASSDTKKHADGTDALMETCLYGLTPTR